MSENNITNVDEIKTNTLTVPEDFDGEIIGAIPIAELEELVEEWQKRGVEDPYGMTWYKPAEELEELIEIHNDE